MESNAVADEIYSYLVTKHERVYRNKAPKNPIFPYVVYRIESGVDSYPSEDLYLNVDVYEDAKESSNMIEALADSIDKGLNHTVRVTEKLNLQFEREVRQYVNPVELISTHLINLRYMIRAYFF